MKTFIKFKEAVILLNDGWEIYTSRGSAPYNALYFHLYKDGQGRKPVHFKTIEKLIKEQIINDTNGGKYELKT